MKPQILLAVLDNKRRRVFESFLEKEQVSYRTVKSLREIVTQAAQHPHNGILIDMPIVVRASQYDKNLVEDTLRALPSARLNITKDDHEILILALGVENRKHCRTASEFIKYCSTLPSKLVAPRNRVPIHLNALLSKSPDMNDPQKTVSIDFSEYGCFLFSTDEFLDPGSSVWIQFTCLQDQTPIQGTICWKRPWGHSDKIPGIGISFDILTNSQQTEIATLVK